MKQHTIGIVANPASGKDVRRLVARASIFDNREKSAIIGRAVTGAVNAGANCFAYVDDSHGISHGAMQVLPECCVVSNIYGPKSATSIDTIVGARELAKLNCIATLVLGGDGTSRVFVKGWRDAVLLPLSTGTNNVFPRFAEATIAGAALGVLASGGVSESEVVVRVKIIDVEIEDEEADVALIDAVVTNDRFVGSRALLNCDAIQTVLLTRAEPSAVGMTSLGGLVRPLSEADDEGLYLQIGKPGTLVHAPIAPGMFQTLSVRKIDVVPFDKPISFKGPCVLAFDGERERVIKRGQEVSMRVSRSGPGILDIEKTMQLASSRQLFSKQYKK